MGIAAPFAVDRPENARGWQRSPARAGLLCAASISIGAYSLALAGLAPAQHCRESPLFGRGADPLEREMIDRYRI